MFEIYFFFRYVIPGLILIALVGMVFAVLHWLLTIWPVLLGVALLVAAVWAYWSRDEWRERWDDWRGSRQQRGRDQELIEQGLASHWPRR